MQAITTSNLRLVFDPESAGWSLIALDKNGSEILGVSSQVQYRDKSGSPSVIQAVSPDYFPADIEQVSSRHGSLLQTNLNGKPDASGVAVRWTYALGENQPFFLWKAVVANQGDQPVWVDRVSMFEPGTDFHFRMAQPIGELGFYSNGWQSWSHTGAYTGAEKMKRSRLGLLQVPMVVNPATPVPDESGHFSSDMFGVLGDRTSRLGVLLGFLSQREQFGSIEAWTAPAPRIKMWAGCDEVRLDPGGELSTDWAMLQFINLDDLDPLGVYLRSAANENEVTRIVPAPVGWCSWYHFYTKVTAEDVKNNLETIGGMQPALPLELVQIDDGFESRPGDWFSFKKSFPEGVAPLAAQIREKGLTPGLWLAPFILDPRARIIREHPDWVLRTESGKPVNAGYVWDRLATALDLTVPEALDYACQVVKTAVEEWGFPYLKLDFLYAAALPGKPRDASLTRAQILRHGLERLREAAGPQTQLLGCGVPLGSALGLFEAVRIGADVSGDWTPAYLHHKKFFVPEWGMPCARNSIQNILSRTALHQRWWINDPDCLLVRPDTALSEAEVQSLAAAIALTGGSLLISDDLPALPPERLRIVQGLIPPIARRPVVLDWFDRFTPQRLRLDLENSTGMWSLLGLFNWEDHPVETCVDLADFRLDPTQSWTAVSFWDGAYLTAQEGRFEPVTLPAHGSLLLACRRKYSELPEYLGSSLHISQGLEIGEWIPEKTSLRFKISLPRRAEGTVTLALPFEPANALVDGQAVERMKIMDGIYRVSVTAEGEAWVEIR